MKAQVGNTIKNTFGSILKIIALSLLIMAMIIILYDYALSDFKYWIAVCITFVSLVLINYDYFALYNKTKNSSKQ